MYKQCKLAYEDYSNAVIWIEDKYAKLNKHLVDEDINKECVVVKVYDDNVKTKDQVRKMERMFKSFKDHDGAYK